MKEHRIELRGIRKYYGKQCRAVDGVDLDIRNGEIFGIVGRNGAGKTTLLKIVAGLCPKYEGTVYFAEPTVTGNLIEAPGLYPHFTATENMYCKALAMGLDQPKRKIIDLLETMDLHHETRRVQTFSMGMRQRLGIAMALLGDPDVLVLDEPINGMDPEGIVLIRETLLRLKMQGKTVLLSSHILSELNRLADRYAILDKGRILKQFTDEELNRPEEKLFVLRVGSPQDAVFALQEKYPDLIFRLQKDGRLEIPDESVPHAKIFRTLAKQDIEILSSGYARKTVEDYYLDAIGGEHEGDA